MDRIYDEQGPDKWVPVAWHCSTTGQWWTNEAVARRGYYGVTGYPTAYVDGIIMHRGAYTNNEQMYQWYMGSFNSRRAVNAPLKITFVQKQYANGKVMVKVKVELEENLSAGHVCHIVLWEDKLSYGGRTYRFVERALETKTLTVTGQGQSEEFSHEFTIQSGWNEANLGLSVFVQDPTGKEIKNARAGVPESAYAVTPTSLGRVKALFN
ncbi:MAG: hypothetical protein JSU81_01875 [Candidatus Coatesbacteria bacterium]|nr:MAG: hypothetical protein JSU81_01875 [Candidatus Coatesbacteria bacterium]